MNATQKLNVVTIPLDKGIIHYFEEAVERFKDLVALKYLNNSLTYEELNVKANQLAHYLCKTGNKKGQRIGLLFHRSLELAVATLAVLKTGGSCVMIDPSLPEDRINYMIKEAGVHDVVMDSKLKNILNGEIRTVVFDLQYAFPHQEHIHNLNMPTNIDDEAFVFYTSGSTGKPKGVLISHGGILNDALPFITEPYLQTNDTLLMNSPSGITRITGELFYPWYAGSKVVILEDKNVMNVEDFIDVIINENITMMFVVPTVLKEMLNKDKFTECKSLKYVHSLGEKLSGDQLSSFYNKLSAAQLLNVYGQTETGCCTLNYCENMIETMNPSVGKPVKNRSIYILDDDLNPVRKGETGEIYIGGMGIALGYLNNFDETQNKFLIDPFLNNSNARMFRTGDLGRLREDGELEHAGRMDHMVKVGGMRVHLEEVKLAIESLKLVHEVAVQAIPNNNDDLYLVAMLVSKDSQRMSNLSWREMLSKLLPAYMIPARYLYVDDLPKLPSGKLDYKQISNIIQYQLDIEEYGESDYKTEIEEKLAVIWSRILNIDVQAIHETSNFIELGGNSIQVASCLLDVEELYDIELDYKLLINMSLQQLSEYLDDNQNK